MPKLVKRESWEERARKSLTGTPHAFFQDMKWQPKEGGGWKIDCYDLYIRGSTLIIYRQWEVPLK